MSSQICSGETETVVSMGIVRRMVCGVGSGSPALEVCVTLGQSRACSRPSLHTMRAAIMFGRLRYDAKHTPTWLS